MMTTILLDKYSRQILDEDQACNMLYTDPCLDVSMLCLDDVSKFNSASSKLHLNTMLTQLDELGVGTQQFHTDNQTAWRMPEEYKQQDIAKYLLDLCRTDAELQRVGQELLLYQERGMFDLLRFLVYIVDTMRNKGLVWGVGRGSSVASYVLYLIGVHKIDSLYYDLDIAEFLR
jgi:DNA polymerase III alpha subunit